MRFFMVTGLWMLFAVVINGQVMDIRSFSPDFDQSPCRLHIVVYKSRAHEAEELLACVRGEVAGGLGSWNIFDDRVPVLCAEELCRLWNETAFF